MVPRLFVGTRKGMFAWSHGPSGWKQDALHFLGEPVTMLLPAHDGALYAVLTLGHFGAKLRRLKPGEKEWVECGVPVYPLGAELATGVPAPDGSRATKAASLAEIWSLEAGGRDEPGVLWAGTIPGGLFRSADYGQTWQLAESLWSRPERARWFGGGKDDPGIHSICVDPRDSRKVTLAISCGGVWHSSDGGESWELRGAGLRAEYVPPELAYDPTSQDAHRLASCTSVPEQMWIQHHNGVFVSSDAGLNWQELSTPRPSPFGFAVAAHPADPQTAWFVPAADDQCRVPVDSRLVVSRTRDGGQSFDVLTRGLPAEPSYDIVYRHGLDVAGDGQTLAMGSTTGGLWASTNGGDDWACLSHTLPPVYCVRFEPAGV